MFPLTGPSKSRTSKIITTTPNKDLLQEKPAKILLLQQKPNAQLSYKSMVSFDDVIVDHKENHEVVELLRVTNKKTYTENFRRRG